ncbi:TolC family protein [Herbaspirillum sp. NPDC087042]|uniref:TolC family protein n=1 Tax=Herbaspirillum sp. NPDC087042 TaxID=3364004 RepID=UPI003805AE5A
MYRHSHLLALALLAPSLVLAQGPTPPIALPISAPATGQAELLTLSSALALADAGNRALAAAQKEIEALDASLEQAGARPNPEFSALMEDTRKSSRTTTYQVNQPIELGGKRSARIEAAERTRDMAVLDHASQRSALHARVRAAFHEAVLAMERQRLARDLVTLAQTAADMTARRVQAGKVSPVEQTRAQLALSNARLEAGQADSDVTLARRQLASLWGATDPGAPLADIGVETLPELPDIGTLTTRVANGPVVQMARLEVERRRALARIESSKRVPDLTVSLGNKRDEEAARNMWVVGFSVPIPVFDSNRGNELEALKRVDKARDEQAMVELQLQNDAAQAYERLRNARQEAQALREDIVPGAQSAYLAARTGFTLGKFAFLDVLDAQRSYFQARAQYWKALSGAFQASAELDRLAGDAALTPPNPQ